MKRDDRRTAGTASALPDDGRGRGEALFVARVRRALDASADALPQATLAKLALARKAALRAQFVPDLRLSPTTEWAAAGASSGPNGSSGRLGFGRASLVGSAILLVGACVAGLYQFEQDRRIEELADVDSAVLSDDLPIAAYADHGFNAFIKQNP